MEEKEVLPGQLRRWKNSFNDHHLAGRTFLVLQEDWERCETEPCWSFLVDGREGVLDFMFIDDPDPPNLMNFVHGE